MRHYYSNAEDAWLKAHISACTSYRHLTMLFNQTFGTSVPIHSVQDHCTKQLHIHRNTNSGIFRKGQRNAKQYQIGDEREYNGYIYVKVNDIQHEGKTTYAMFGENWMPKQRYVYQKHNGEIPDGHIVIFLDNNKRNFAPENLYCISRSVHAVMNKNRWFTDDREHTLTAIRWCELHFALNKKISAKGAM